MSTTNTVGQDELYEAVQPLLNDRTRHILERRRRGPARRRGWLVRRMLAIADVLGLTLAFSLSFLFGDAGTPGVAWEFLIFALTLPLWIVAARLYGLYDSDEERTDHSTADDLVGVFHLVTVGSWLFFLAAATSGFYGDSVERQIIFWLMAIFLVTSARASARALCRRTFAYSQNTIIVGAGDVGQLIAHKFRQHPEYGINLIGFVDANPKDQRPDLEGVHVLGATEQLAQLVRLLDVERVVFAFSEDSHEELLGAIRSLKDADVQIDIVPRLFEVLGTNVGIHTAEGVPLIGLPRLRLSRSARLMKRTVDLVLAGFSLLLLAPVLAVVAVAIKLDSPGPVMFRQVRRGSDESLFRIYKFRTMTADAEERKASLASLNKHASNGGDPRMFKIPEDPRTTRVGRVLRRYSFDEFPQLINVIRGEMSLVGPRPLILDEDQHVLAWQRHRLALKPGITGLWQVLGRDNIPFEEMVKLDYLYITTWSVLNDLKLILRTIPLVARAHDV